MAEGLVISTISCVQILQMRKSVMGLAMVLLVAEFERASEICVPLPLVVVSA